MLNTIFKLVPSFYLGVLYAVFCALSDDARHFLLLNMKFHILSCNII